MSSDRGPLDSGHLDEDAECLEDPVHCGDARHQHEQHARPVVAERPAPPPAGGDVPV